MVYAAFCGKALKGFVSVEAELFGSGKQYLDLTSLHVSGDLRGRGIGRELFLEACRWAKQRGAAKLYISGHSAVETQAFYRELVKTQGESKTQQAPPLCRPWVAVSPLGGFSALLLPRNPLLSIHLHRWR